jgi:hypothetical protein
MIINKQRIFKSKRICKAVFGMSFEEIQELLPVFKKCLLEYRYELYPNRIRKVGGGRKGDLPTDEDKLLYILMYLKVYPTYDVLSILADHQRSKCGDTIKLLLPVLEKTLKRKLVLPKRKVSSLKEVFERCPELKDVFIDGSERPVQKPVNNKRKNKLYSGKKKTTTRKTIVVNDEKKRILFMSPTKSGRRHDKKITDKIGLARAIPENVTIWTDTGFQGIQHSNTIMPKKNTKNTRLTDEQKRDNMVISGIRIVSEHAIGGYKRFKAASDIYRNKLPNMDDKMSVVCAGLWNFHLERTI